MEYLNLCLYVSLGKERSNNCSCYIYYCDFTQKEKDLIKHHVISMS